MVYQYNNKGLVKVYDSINQVEKETGIAHQRISEAIKGKFKLKGFMFSKEELDIQDILYDIQIQKQLVKQQDLNRIRNKKFRDVARMDNATSAYAEQLKELLPEFMTEFTIKHKTIGHKSTIIIQLSDLHLNELVDLPNNSYDFNVASKRLQKFADIAKLMIASYNAKKVVIAITGDLINSDRRLDEIMSMSTSRAKATLIAVNLLKHFILDINSVANVDVVAISGNESRIREDFGYTDKMITDNFDFVIFNMLRYLFNKKDGVIFHEIQNPVETVISVNGLNILMLHGETVKKDTQAGIQQIIGKYSQKGVLIHYVIFGHVHFANITDLYARSGSLVGNNTYSDHGLNLVTKPSQNLHIIDEEGSIHNMRVELDKVKNFEGYDIQDDVEAYNAKAADKLLSSKSILQILV